MGLEKTFSGSKRDEPESAQGKELPEYLGDPELNRNDRIYSAHTTKSNMLLERGLRADAITQEQRRDITAAHIKAQRVSEVRDAQQAIYQALERSRVPYGDIEEKCAKLFKIDEQGNMDI